MNNGLLEEARSRAEDSIEGLLLSLQGDEAWQITFENAE